MHTIGNFKTVDLSHKFQFVFTTQAIMVNGEFKCLGSTQHLKNKFSKGFFLTIKINRDNSPGISEQEQQTAEVKNFVDSNFAEAILK